MAAARESISTSNTSKNLHDQSSIEISVIDNDRESDDGVKLDGYNLYGRCTRYTAGTLDLDKYHGSHGYRIFVWAAVASAYIVLSKMLAYKIYGFLGLLTY